MAKSQFEDVEFINYADITKDGIKYKQHFFNAKTMGKDKAGKEVEVTVVRLAEREWLCAACSGGRTRNYVIANSAMVFALDLEALKIEAVKVQKFVFGE